MYVSRSSFSAILHLWRKSLSDSAPRASPYSNAGALPERNICLPKCAPAKLLGRSPERCTIRTAKSMSRCSSCSDLELGKAIPQNLFNPLTSEASFLVRQPPRISSIKIRVSHLSSCGSHLIYRISGIAYRTSVPAAATSYIVYQESHIAHPKSPHPAKTPAYPAPKSRQPSGTPLPASRRSWFCPAG